MFEIDTSVSWVENFIRKSEKLKVDSLVLHDLLERSTVNRNGRMGSQEAIDHQAKRVYASAKAVEALGLCLKTIVPKVPTS